MIIKIKKDEFDRLVHHQELHTEGGYVHWHLNFPYQFQMVRDALAKHDADEVHKQEVIKARNNAGERIIALEKELAEIKKSGLCQQSKSTEWINHNEEEIKQYHYGIGSIIEQLK